MGIVLPISGAAARIGRNLADPAHADDPFVIASNMREKTAQDSAAAEARQSRLEELNKRLAAQPPLPGIPINRGGPEPEDPYAARHAATEPNYGQPGGSSEDGAGGPEIGGVPLEQVGSMGPSDDLSDADIADLRTQAADRQRAGEEASRTAVLLQQQTTPDQAASDLATANRLGVNRAEVEQDRGWFSKADRARNLNAVIATAPKLNTWLKDDPANLEVAHDDAENLSWWEKTGAAMGKALTDFTPTFVKQFGAAVGEAPSLLKDVPGNLPKAFAAGVPQIGETIFDMYQMGADLADEFGRSAMPISFKDSFTPAEIKSLRETGKLPEKPRNEGDILPNASRVLGAKSEELRQTADRMLPKGSNDIESGIYSGAQSFTGQLPGLVAAGLTGQPELAMNWGAALTAGPAYKDARAAGRSVSEATIYAIGQGEIERYTELLPMHSLFGEGAAKSLIGKAMKSMASELPGEQIATLLQDANEQATLHPEMTVADYLKARPSAAMQTLVATVFQSAMGAGIAHVSERTATAIQDKAIERRTGQVADMFKVMGQQVQDSKLAKRLPDKFREFVATATKDGPVESVRVTPEGLREVAEANKLDVGALAQAFRIDPNEIAQAETTGQDVVIPTDKYAAGLAEAKKTFGVEGSALNDALIPHMKLKETDFTPAQWQAHQAVIKESEEARKQWDVTENAFMDSADRVRAHVLQRVRDTGLYGEHMADTQAQIISAMAVTDARRQGVDPWEHYQKEWDGSITSFANPLEDTGEALNQSRTPQQVDDATMLAASEKLSPSEFEAWKLATVEGLGNEDIAARMADEDGRNATIEKPQISDALSPETRSVIQLRAEGVDRKAIAARVYPGRDTAKALNQIDQLSHKHKSTIEALKRDAARGFTAGTVAVHLKRARDKGFEIERLRGGKETTRETGRVIALKAQGVSNKLIAERIYPDRASDKAENLVKQIVFQHKDEIAAQKEKLVLAQDKRGDYTPSTEGPGAIRLFEGAQPDTLIHEAWHRYMDVVWRMSVSANPHPSVLRQVDAWLKANDKPADWNNYFAAEPFLSRFDGKMHLAGSITDEAREMQEALAETATVYMREGKAPSSELRSAFASFRVWLLDLYREFKKRFIDKKGRPKLERANLTDDMREFFDRALAADDAIAAARSRLDMDATQLADELLRQNIITPAKYEQTKARLPAAREEAVTNYTMHLMENYKRDRTAAYKDDERRTKAEVTREVDSAPEQRAYAWLSGKGWMGETLPEAGAAQGSPLDQQNELLDFLKYFEVDATDENIAKLRKRMLDDGVLPALRVFRTPNGRIMAFPMDWTHAEARDLLGLGSLRLEHGMLRGITQKPSELKSFDWYGHSGSTDSTDTPDEALGQFMGDTSPTAPLRTLSKAIMLSIDSKGLAPHLLAREIWQRTGWAQTKNGEWIWEVPGNPTFKFNPEKTAQAGRLDQMIDWPELFEAMPILRQVYMSATVGAQQGGFNPVGLIQHKDGRTSIGPTIRASGAVTSSNTLMETIRHEIQHVIQLVSGFKSTGANSKPDDYRGTQAFEAAKDAIRKLEDKYQAAHLGGAILERFTEKELDEAAALKLYSQNHGEWQARDVEFRSRWTPEVKQYLPPGTRLGGETENVSESQTWASLDDLRFARWVRPPPNVATPEPGRFYSDLAAGHENQGQSERESVRDPDDGGQVGGDELGKVIPFARKPPTFQQLERQYLKSMTDLQESKDHLDGLLAEDPKQIEIKVYEEALADARAEPQPDIRKIRYYEQRIASLKSGDDGALAQPAGSNWGPSSPPPELSPMRLDLGAVAEQYGEEALAKLPPEVRAHAANSTDADGFLQVARDTAKTLKQKRPRSLWKFLATRRRVGNGNDRIAYSGIRDEGGEIAAMIGAKGNAPGLIADKTKDAKTVRSYDLHDAAVAAWEEGYTPEVLDDNAFLDALRRDLDGTAPSYRTEDQERVAQIASAEVWEQWFDAQGIDITDTPEAIKAKLEEALSGEAEGAIGPDEAAPLLGFKTGEDLLEGLQKGPQRDALIKAETQRRMSQKHGDPFRDGTIMREAEVFARNEIQARQFEIELEALAKAAGQFAAANLAKQAAKDSLATKQVREVLNYNQWLVLEQRWGQKAFDLAKKGKFAEAMVAKRNQLVNMHMFREGRKLAERIEKSRKALLAYGSKAKQVRLMAAGADYAENMNSLLADYQLRDESKPAEDRRAQRAAWILAKQAGIDPFAAYADPSKTPEEQRAEAQEVLDRSAVLRALTEGNESARNYKALTVTEFEGVRDEADMIYRLATRLDALVREGERRRLSLAAEDIAAEIITNQPNEKPPEALESDAPGEVAKRGLLKYFAMHRQLQSFALQFAGGKDGGVFWNYIVRPLNEAFAKLSGLRKTMGKDLTTLFGAYTPKEIARFYKDRAFIPEINRSMTTQGRLAVALNLGNEKNRKRLMDSNGWDDAQVQAIVSTLTKRDWDFVQATWDYLDTWFPEANRVHEAVHSAPMDKVEPLQVATKFGIYRGGYYPISFDPNLSSKSGQRQIEADAKSSTGRIGVRNVPGFSKQRVAGKVTLPLRLSVFDVITRHLDQVATSIATEEALFDAGRLVQRPEVEDAIISRHGRQVYNSIVNMLVTTKFGMEGTSGILAHLRNGSTVVGLGWRVATALLQPLGITNSIVRVGGFWIAKGYAEMGHDAVSIQSSAQRIMEKSEFMRHRRESQSPELSALRETLRKTSVTPKWITRSMFAMMSNMQFYSVDMPTWYGAYLKAQAAGLEESDSVAQADQAVIDAQGGGDIHQTASIQTGAGTKYAAALRLLTNFLSYQITTYNLSVQRIRNARTKAQVAALGLDLILMLSVPVAGKMLLDAWTKGGGPDDDDPLWEQFLREQAAFLMSPFVGIGQVSGAARGDKAFSYRGPAGLNILSESYNATKAAAEGDFDESFWRPANKMAGIIFHYPAGQIDTTVRGAEALYNGETDNPAAVLFGPPPKN